MPLMIKLNRNVVRVYLCLDNGHFITVEDNDFERCLDMINARLLGAGYPELYIGNPYDWLFMWALKDYDNPLFAFRYYMGEVFAEAAEN